jgi:hypothetical protein
MVAPAAAMTALVILTACVVLGPILFLLVYGASHSSMDSEDGEASYVIPTIASLVVFGVSFRFSGDVQWLGLIAYSSATVCFGTIATLQVISWWTSRSDGERRPFPLLPIAPAFWVFGIVVYALYAFGGSYNVGVQAASRVADGKTAIARNRTILHDIFQVQAMPVTLIWKDRPTTDVASFANVGQEEERNVSTLTYLGAANGRLVLLDRLTCNVVYVPADSVLMKSAEIPEMQDGCYPRDDVAGNTSP